MAALQFDSSDVAAVGVSPEGKPGKVLGLLAQLRKSVGTLKAKPKAGVKFKVRSVDELVDKVRPVADELGLLIYPAYAQGRGHVVEDGTLAEVTLTVRIQAIEDGSHIDVYGFGLGADNQDKAGGKAGTYAFKAALIQALLAGGSEDTDDTDTPIAGGVKPRTAKPKAPTVDDVKAALEVATDRVSYKLAVEKAMKMSPEDQIAVADDFRAAKTRLGL